ncbi:ribosomal protein S18-alanine N-acetyltransferase [Microbacterium sp. zg.Y1090]|uniref:ribosomal protein S18-alanine N-acetyltransferase n=1 Tax=Microbacterium wangruii TaxID=3049073 RepID=UPI00214D02B6|nr:MULTISPECIES: ribosomal protein S18-alanine N-acetyltransferase [unclassified Microbacterium]MCR2817898.1 ribosomal protein S18-alanine N-acetyltransferase [Microbacterium sp. zg.Y1090]WIM27933.1 ribosomal protein S18-alanine N-acetyltransferase [Microbacterium sp. zg-Y1090]
MSAGVRTATVADLGAIMALERAAFPTDAWSETAMRAEIASPHGRYLALEEAGVLVGYAGLRAPAGAKDADVQTIAVAAAARGRGYGRTLLRALLTEAASRGAAEVFLEVRADNPVAAALYASEGFTELGRRPRYYQPDDVDAVVMRLDLRSWATSSVPDPGAGGTLSTSADVALTDDAAIATRTADTAPPEDRL